MPLAWAIRLLAGTDTLREHRERRSLLPIFDVDFLLSPHLPQAMHDHIRGLAAVAWDACSRTDRGGFAVRHWGTAGTGTTMKIERMSHLYRISRHGPFSPFEYRVTVRGDVGGPSATRVEAAGDPNPRPGLRLSVQRIRDTHIIKAELNDSLYYGPGRRSR